VGHAAGLDGCGKFRSPPPGFVPWTVQSVTSRYTDYAIPAPECLLVALSIQHGQRLRHIVNYGLSDSTIFFPHHLINGRILAK
jgi:hypothetical protein